VGEPKCRYDRPILWIVEHVLGRGVLVLAGVSQLRFGLALPSSSASRLRGLRIRQVSLMLLTTLQAQL